MKNKIIFISIIFVLIISGCLLMNSETYYFPKYKNKYPYTIIQEMECSLGYTKEKDVMKVIERDGNYTYLQGNYGLNELYYEDDDYLYRYIIKVENYTHENIKISDIKKYDVKNLDIKNNIKGVTMKQLNADHSVEIVLDSPTNSGLKGFVKFLIIDKKDEHGKRNDYKIGKGKVLEKNQVMMEGFCGL